MSPLVLLLPPALAGGLLVLLGPRLERAAAPAAAAVSAGTLALVLLAGPGPVRVPFLLDAAWVLALDGLSRALAATVCVVTTCVLLAVPTQVERRRGRAAGWLLLFLAAVLLTLLARDLLSLLVGWELMGAASYALIATDLRDRRAAGSATAALLTTRALDVGLYAAAGAALAGVGTLALDALPGASGWPLHLAALGVLAAALGKAAQLPVSWWLSRAMDGPSPVSALLHSAAMVAMGGYLLLRTGPLLVASGWADDAAAWTGALTAVVLGVVALAQRDLKQLLAASTASQLGLVVLAAGVSATAAGGLHLVAHAAVKALLFLAAGVWLHALGTRDLQRLRGALVRTPFVGVLAAVGLLALAGVPPLALWTSKDAVLAAVLERSPVLHALGLAASALSAAYAGRALVLLLREPAPARPRDGDREADVPGPVRVPWTAWAPLVPLALGAALLGALGLGAADVAPGLEGLLEPTGLAVSAAVAVGVLVLVVLRGDALVAALPRGAGDWLGLERATSAVAVRPVLALAGALAALDRVLDRGVLAAAGGVRSAARALARFDDGPLDGAVRGTARAGTRSAGLADRVDDTRLDAVVRGVAAGTRRLGALARLPQTGQLHQYYGQAAAVLVAATLLLLLTR